MSACSKGGKGCDKGGRQWWAIREGVIEGGKSNR